MNRYGLALVAILAASPCATGATTDGWANVTTCHKCAECYGVRAMALRECQAEWPEGSPYASN
jgi:hypothetical protein